jgi:translocation and assembly module TamA
MMIKGASCLLLTLAMSNPVFASALNLKWQVNGVTGDALENVNARLTAEKELHEPLQNQTDIDSFMKQTPATIQKALEPFGYFNSKVTTSIQQETNTRKLIIHIIPGPVIHVTHIQLVITGAGATSAFIHEMKPQFTLKTGDPFTAASYETAKENLFNAISNQGYIKASFINKEVVINPTTNTASITLTLDTGEQYYFGDIQYEKNPYNPEFLKRFITLNKNEPFSSKKLLAIQQSLEKSRYFQAVILTPEYHRTQNHRIPITVQLGTPKAKKYNIGVGFGTLTGPRLTAGVEWRRVTDTGHAFSAQTRLSSTLNSIAAKYYIPGPQPLTDQYMIGVNAQKFVPKNGESESREISIGFSRTLPVWQYHLNLNYLAERFSVDEKPTTNSNVLYPSLSIGYNRTNDLFNPTSGYVFNLTLLGADKSLVSETRFFQADVKGKYLFSPTPVSLIVLKGELGYTVVNDLNSLPLSLRFFAGGPSSLRGYQDSSIGPGRYLTTATAEYQHQIYGNWYGAIFHDVGNATDHYDEPLKQSTGAGIVYQSLIGPIKIYVARAHGIETGPWRIQFSLGPD